MKPILVNFTGDVPMVGGQVRKTLVIQDHALQGAPGVTGHARIEKMIPTRIGLALRVNNRNVCVPWSQVGSFEFEDDENILGEKAPPAPAPAKGK